MYVAIVLKIHYELLLFVEIIEKNLNRDLALNRSNSSAKNEFFTLMIAAVR